MYRSLSYKYRILWEIIICKLSIKTLTHIKTPINVIFLSEYQAIKIYVNVANFLHYAFFNVHIIDAVYLG